MANLFDQYQEAAITSSSVPRRAMTEPTVAGLINEKKEDDKPIFNKQRINYNPRDPITHLCICNNYLVMAMSSNVLLRMDLNNTETTHEVEIPRALDDRIYKMFLDPTGKHLLISMISSENFYLSRGTEKPRALGKLKGHQISAVGWNKQTSTDATTGAILLGTTKGVIFETEIVCGEDGRFFSASLEQYVKQLYNLSKEKVYPVTGLEVEKMAAATTTHTKYFVMATLPGRLYQFIGNVSVGMETPVFQHLFLKYETEQPEFLDLPGNFGNSELHLYHPKPRAAPTYFAWMAGPGIYCGSIETNMPQGKGVTTDTKLILYPRVENERPETPLSVILTEFHVVVLFPDRLKAICVLNEQLVYEDIFSDRFGRLSNMCKDPVSGTIWAFTSSSVFKYKVYREGRDMWQMYLDKGDFDLAKKYASDSKTNIDKVLRAQAKALFEEKKFKESAEIYAQTMASFEEVSLKLIELKDKDALKTFLIKNLLTLKAHEKTQVTMLSTWLVEIFLSQLGEMREESAGAPSSNPTNPRYSALQDEFRKFLAHSRIKDCVTENKKMVYDLIASHGDVENMVFFAVLIKDYERVVSHYLQQNNYSSALEKIAEQKDLDLFYKFSPVLMQNIPHETVDAWIAQRDKLDPKKLIPALVQYDHSHNRKQGNEAIRYLEFCTQMLNNRDEAIHNYLLSLYSKLQPDALITYLNFQGQDPEQVCYDLKYALRLCSEQRQSRACVHIYSTMGLYEEAVDLALKEDIDLAKANADKPEEDEDRKKLWLKIARHVVEQQQDIRQAMEFLHDCDLLKIEDILPFFPDFVTIDHFKDAICTSLAQYNEHIDSLKDEMEEATESAREIRADINAFRNKYTTVKAQEKCSSCGYPLMTRAFYLFPCMHKFHSDCLIAEVLPHMSVTRRHKVEDLQRKLASKDRGTSNPPVSSMQAQLPMSSPEFALKEELDDLVAGECVYCGETMIRCIDEPFIEGDDLADISSWL